MWNTYAPHTVAARRRRERVARREGRPRERDSGDARVCEWVSLNTMLTNEKCTVIHTMAWPSRCRLPSHAQNIQIIDARRVCAAVVAYERVSVYPLQRVPNRLQKTIRRTRTPSCFTPNRRVTETMETYNRKMVFSPFADGLDVRVFSIRARHIHVAGCVRAFV